MEDDCSAVQCAGTTAWLAGPTVIQPVYPLAGPAVQCNAVHRHAVHYTALHCTALHYTALRGSEPENVDKLIGKDAEPRAEPSNL